MLNEGDDKMKKIYSVIAVTCSLFMLVGCSGQKAQESNTASKNETSVTTVAESEQEVKISFDDVTVKTDNPIDTYIGGLLAAATSTRKYEAAAQQFSDLWLAEFKNAADLCQKNGASQYDPFEYDNILNKANEAYNNVVNAPENAGSSTLYGEATYEKGEVYRQGTYYYIAIYEQSTKQPYEFLYK